jgi:hypothetical protein
MLDFIGVTNLSKTPFFVLTKCAVRRMIRPVPGFTERLAKGNRKRFFEAGSLRNGPAERFDPAGRKTQRGVEAGNAEAALRSGTDNGFLVLISHQAGLETSQGRSSQRPNGSGRPISEEDCAAKPGTLTSEWWRKPSLGASERLLTDSDSGSSEVGSSAWCT